MFQVVALPFLSDRQQAFHVAILEQDLSQERESSFKISIWTENML